MASNPAGPDPPTLPRDRVFGKVRLIATAVLLASLIGLFAFSWITRDAVASLQLAHGRNAQNAADTTVVDLHPWETAEALASLAVTAEEGRFARDAERLADHEVDQAFATALRQAAAERPVLTLEALKLQQRLTQLQQLVKQDQAHVDGLTNNSNRSATPGHLAADVDVAKAQLGLDSDELADAQQDFARAVGDRRNTIQQELAAHEAAMRKYDAESSKQGPTAVTSAQQYGSLAKLVQAWSAQTTRAQLIKKARVEAQTERAALVTAHNRLEGVANTASTAAAQASETDKALTIASLNSRAAQRQLLNIYDDRIQTTEQLAAVYANWSAQLSRQQKIVLHLLMQSLALIAFILLAIVLCDALARYLLDRTVLDRRRMQTLRIIFKLCLRIVALLLILLVVFGTPSQMPTIIGFTTAGLTVVLQDFILSFLGWFILMGKNGIRVGDWVEINGISGEVVETGLFRTVMLETGNWTDKGHPTGRRVTLMNSFAIKGQYFNFSTTGQWMWDQITLTVAPAENTYRVIELIHKTVLAETESAARLAEEEWKRVSRRKGLGLFTAASSVDMRPGLYGIDITVRYVTRASERFEVRNRLYSRVIDLLHEWVAPRTLADQPLPAISSTQ